MLFNKEVLKEAEKLIKTVTIRLVNRESNRSVLSLNVTEYQLSQMLREQDDLQFVVKDDGVQFFGAKADNGDGLSSGYDVNGIFKLCFVQAKDVNRDIVGLSEEDLAVDFNFMAKE